MQAPATFQHIMNALLGDVSDYFEAYLDNVIILTKTINKQFPYILENLVSIREEDLTIKEKMSDRYV